ncbi:MAG: hypothetical protein H0V43_02490, partial [Gemmatimonadales bacterium]|nr:hypothetical protein [Gemmatimonadales bacterium]
MTQRRTRLALTFPLALTLGLALARVWGVPSLSDPLGAPLPDGLSLTLPWSHMAVAPLFTLWDGVSMLSLGRLKGFLIGSLLLFLLWRLGRAIGWRGTTPGRELGAILLGILALAAFIAAGLLWHRPMAALAGAGADRIVADFHT